MFYQWFPQNIQPFPRLDFVKSHETGALHGGRLILRRCRCCGPLFMAFHAWEENIARLWPEVCSGAIRQACPFRYMFDHFCLEMMIFFHNTPLLPLTWTFCWSTSSLNSAAKSYCCHERFWASPSGVFDVKYIGIGKSSRVVGVILDKLI